MSIIGTLLGNILTEVLKCHEKYLEVGGSVIAMLTLLGKELESTQEYMPSTSPGLHGMLSMGRYGSISNTCPATKKKKRVILVW